MPPALLGEWRGSCTCYCGNTRVERIPKQDRVSTKSWSWRWKFSCRSRWDLNLQHNTMAVKRNWRRWPLLFWRLDNQYSSDQEEEEEMSPMVQCLDHRDNYHSHYQWTSSATNQKTQIWGWGKKKLKKNWDTFSLFIFKLSLLRCTQGNGAERSSISPMHVFNMMASK